MNLIECWKLAKNGQIVDLNGKYRYKKGHDTIKNRIFHDITLDDLLADDWEILKTPKKVVIEDVMIKVESFETKGYHYLLKSPVKMPDGHNKNKFKMTLEWSE